MSTPRARLIHNTATTPKKLIKNSFSSISPEPEGHNRPSNKAVAVDEQEKKKRSPRRKEKESEKDRGTAIHTSPHPSDAGGRKSDAISRASWLRNKNARIHPPLSATLITNHRTTRRGRRFFSLSGNSSFCPTGARRRAPLPSAHMYILQREKKTRRGLWRWLAGQTRSNEPS